MKSVTVSLPKLGLNTKVSVLPPPVMVSLAVVLVRIRLLAKPQMVLVPSSLFQIWVYSVPLVL